MKDYSEIQCPDCGGKIFIEARLLLQGASFNCSNPDCDASVSLSQSGYQVANSAIEEFEKFKGK